MNHRPKFQFSALLVLALSLSAASGQEARTNAPIPVFRRTVNPHWFAGNDKFWYRITTGTNQAGVVLVDAATGKRAPAFDQKRLAAALGKMMGTNIASDKLPFTTIRFADDGKSFLFKPISRDGGTDTIKYSDGKNDLVIALDAGTVWRCDLASYQITKADGETLRNEPADEGGGGRRGRRGGGGGGGGQRAFKADNSPDGNWEPFIKDYNLYLRNISTKEEFALTTDGCATNTYAKDVEKDRGVGMEFTLKAPETPVPEVYWSPDSRHLVAIRTQAGTERTVYYVESSPPDQFQPKLKSYPYLKAGDAVPFTIPHLFDVASKKEIPVHQDLFANQWSVEEFRWKPDSSSFMFLYNQRGHQVLRMLDLNPESGEVKPIIEEHSDTFIDYAGRTKHYAHYLTNTDEFIWMSERDGWNHLYLYDAKTGKVKNQITKGEWVVVGVETNGVDAVKRQITFRASGIHPGQDPYLVQYCRVNFDGTGLTVLTEGNGTHSIAWSPDRRYLIDTYSRVDLPPVNELRRGDTGKLVCKLEEADAGALKKAGLLLPEPFAAKARDGVTDIYGVIVRPKNFNPKKKYPVLENVYAGPHDFFTPKEFGAADRFQTLADKGFIVVESDGLGTSGRSKKFHDVCWKNIIDAGFPDRILWMKAVAAKYPALDLTRVGIYGTSAGGQNALDGILTHPEFYAACVADCGCHDNRMDKIWWNEAWMGWPVGPEYEKNSNLSYVKNLKGKLFLMVGEDDENVDPATTLKVVNALIKADKDFDLLVMPEQGHGVASTAYGRRRLADFFIKNLQDPDAVTAPQHTAAPSQ